MYTGKKHTYINLLKFLRNFSNESVDNIYLPEKKFTDSQFWMRNITPNPFTHKANVDFSNICMKMKHHFPMKNVYRYTNLNVPTYALRPHLSKLIRTVSSRRIIDLCAITSLKYSKPRNAKHSNSQMNRNAEALCLVRFGLVRPI